MYVIAKWMKMKKKLCFCKLSSYWNVLVELIIQIFSDNLAAILFLLIKRSEIQNMLWEQVWLNSAYSSYGKNCGSRRLLRNASSLRISVKRDRNFDARKYFSNALST